MSASYSVPAHSHPDGARGIPHPEDRLDQGQPPRLVRARSPVGRGARATSSSLPTGCSRAGVRTGA